MKITHLGKVYGTYGQAAQMAQLLEKEMALLILIPSMTNKGEPSAELLTQTIAELDALPLGRLKGRLKEYANLGDGLSQLLDKANEERKFLTHHFFEYYHDMIGTEEGQLRMIRRLEEIRDLLKQAYKHVSKASIESFTSQWCIPKDKVAEDLAKLKALKEQRS